MGRCYNIATNKLGLNTLHKNTEVSFTVLSNIESCVTINTKKYLSYNGESVVYDSFDCPKDMLNCHGEKCLNTGTLLLTGSGEEGVSAKFSNTADARDFVAGVLTFYVKVPQAGAYLVTTTVSDIKNDTQSNADIYERSVTATGSGFYPLVIDFSKLPSEVKGRGWQASDLGVMIDVAIKATSAVANSTYGISSLAIFESIEDLEANDMVVVGCIDDFAGDITIDATEAGCFGSTYDASTIAMERTLTAKSVTPNYWKLNPLMNKGDKVDGWSLFTEEKEVLKAEINGITFGYVPTNEMYLEECGFTYASASDNCKVTESILTKVSTPVAIELNQNQFMVLDGKFYFHELMIGKNVLISYPKQIDGEHFVASDKSVGERKVKMSFAIEQNDGFTQHYVYNNVLITSFPMSLSSEEQTFEFTINILPDHQGNFFEMLRVGNH